MNHEDRVKAELWSALDALPTAVNLRRVFLLLTQAHFAHADNFGLLKETLKDCIWNPDAEERQIHVALQSEFDPRGVFNTLPSVFFGFGDSNFEQEVVSGYAGHNDDNSAADYVMKAEASIQWVHCAHTDTMTGNLAETVFSLLAGARPWLIEKLGLRAFMIGQLSMPVKVKMEGVEPYYRVDLRCTLHYNHVLTLSTESHRLKKVAHDFTLTADVT